MGTEIKQPLKPANTIACQFCEDGKPHPVFVFLATSGDYTKISRSRNPWKVICSFQGKKGHPLAKGFPRDVSRKDWKVQLAVGMFESDELSRQFETDWASEETVERGQKLCEEYNKRDGTSLSLKCYTVGP